VDQAERLHQMCHEVLAEADVKAICKTRGLPNLAGSSRHLFEHLFHSDTGVADAHVAFFGRLDPPKNERWSYGTFTQPR
jgi:hypothetical protein